MTMTKWEFSLDLLGGVLIAWWLGLGTIYHVFAVLMILDLASGVIAVLASGGQLSSEKMGRGLLRKGMEVIVVLTAGALVPIVPVQGGGMLIAEATAGFFVVREALSVLENAGVAGLPIPQKLRDVLTVLGSDKGP